MSVSLFKNEVLDHQIKLIKVGTRPQICEKKTFSGEETPIFGLYVAFAQVNYIIYFT